MGFNRDSTRYGSTALSFFSHHGGPAAIRALLKAGGKANAPNAQGETPLLLLTRSDLKAPYTPEQEEAVGKVAELLLSICPTVNTYLTSDRESLLHYACRAGKFSPEGIEETKLLLKAGADPGKAEYFLTLYRDVLQ